MSVSNCKNIFVYIIQAHKYDYTYMFPLTYSNICTRLYIHTYVNITYALIYRYIWIFIRFHAWTLTYVH